jgi:hypothetical protein
MRLTAGNVEGITKRHDAGVAPRFRNLDSDSSMRSAI